MLATGPDRSSASLTHIDEAQWGDRLRQDFDPEISINIVSYKIGTLSQDKTSIKGKDIEILREGAIYFRYAGQSRPIGYGTKRLIQDREERRVKAFMDHHSIKKIGVDRTGILKMTEQSSSIFMTPQTAKGLSLIDEGLLCRRAWRACVLF